MAETPQRKPPRESTRDDKELEALHAYRMLTPEQRELIAELAEMLAKGNGPDAQPLRPPYH